MAIVEHRAAGLVAYLAELNAVLQEPRARLGEEAVTFLAWAWKHRQDLARTDAAGAWPQAPSLAPHVWETPGQTVRTTGMVEKLNSILAPHCAAHRGLPANVLSVFPVYRNHHVFARGKRAGHSPLELLGLPSADWIDALGCGRSQAGDAHAISAEFANIVNTLAA